MLLALSSMICEIDEYSEKSLGISLQSLMKRAGEVVARVVRERVEKGSRVVVLAGKGNNGGDGYAAASELFEEYDLLVYDVFSAGQRTEEGKHFLEEYKQKGGRIENLTLSEKQKEEIKSADCIIDAIFGTGFLGELPELITSLIITLNESVGATKIAIDVPVGINADDGSICVEAASTMSATVALCFIKPGLVSYPAKAYVGKIIYDDLGLPLEKIKERFSFNYYLTDSELASSLIPKREDNSNKGSFGKLLLITGSERFKGAGYLSLEAALRSGVGYVSFVGDSKLCDSLVSAYPEAIYKPYGKMDNLTDDEILEITELSKGQSATLIGSGSGDNESIRRLTYSLLTSEGGALILDADAINSLAAEREKSISIIKEAKRRVILTPHPLEFARLSGSSVSDVQLHRIESAIKFAKENKVVLVLKGAATVITDGDRLYVNSSGSSALAKAGSGDVLAGIISSVIATGKDPLEASALSVYYHGSAADELAKELSVFGVTPSDLPKEVARQIAKETGNK